MSNPLITCTNCKRENPATEKLCLYCGTVLSGTHEPVSTRALSDTDFGDGEIKWGTASFNARTVLVIHERNTKKRLKFYFDEFEELVLGRSNPETGEVPSVDLSDYDAAEKGVSRRHASIVRRENALDVVDLGAANGTFLNGHRLIPNQARLLRDGDELRLGHLVLRISFARV